MYILISRAGRAGQTPNPYPSGPSRPVGLRAGRVFRAAGQMAIPTFTPQFVPSKLGLTSSSPSIRSPPLSFLKFCGAQCQGLWFKFELEYLKFKN